jgi:hypothetical protein
MPPARRSWHESYSALQTAPAFLVSLKPSAGSDETTEGGDSIDPGLLALSGIFALAGICALWGWSYARSIERRLAAQGFDPCDAEAPSLEGDWRALTGLDASQELSLVRCRRRAAGRGALYHFTVRERPVDGRSSDDTANPGASYPAYLFNVRTPASVSRGPVTLHVLPPGSTIMRKALAGLIDIGDSRPRLEVGARPWSATIVAAHGSAGGRLDDLVPEAIQEKIARAPAHGFFIVHLANGKAGLAALPSHRDVDRQLAYLEEWV